jgi:hypothetical protein
MSYKLIIYNPPLFANQNISSRLYQYMAIWTNYNDFKTGYSAPRHPK